MDPIFTIPWEEYHLAHQLQKHFSKNSGYSIFVPLSRQEKGIDLSIIHRYLSGKTKTVTFQVKRSRTYPGSETKRITTKSLKHFTWFNRFPASNRADFFILFTTYPYFDKRNNNWVYKHSALLFNNKEMRKFLSECKTVKGRIDKMFGFGFDDAKDIFQTRGDRHRKFGSFKKYLLENRLDDIRRALK